MHGADLVILATPVAVILDHLPRLQPHLSPQALITDVGSTKRRICERAAELYAQGPLFLGGHPMAGKERSGLENADARLFENARYVLTPIKPEHLDDARVQAFRALVAAIGARPLTTDPATHDLAVAYLSHLPQLLSSGLASLIEEKHAAEDLISGSGGLGFPRCDAPGRQPLLRLARHLPDQHREHPNGVGRADSEIGVHQGAPG